MRTRIALLLAGALALGACGQSDEPASEAGTDTPAATESATDAPTDAPSDGATDAAGEGAQAEPVSGDLPEGVAATVGDTEVTVEELDARLALIREIPQVKEQLGGEGDTAQLESQLQTQALGQLVLQNVVLQAAAEEDVTVDDAQVEERRAQLAEEAGGDEAFAEQLASAGVPEDQVARELRASIAFELVTEKLMADAPAPSETPSEGGSEGGTEAPADAQTPPQDQQVQQDWLVETVSEADVVVDEAYGAWDPTTGQVVPA